MITDRLFRILAKTNLFQGFFKIDEYVFNHTKHDGTISETLTREIFDRGEAVSVLLYDPKIDSVMIIEEFRPGIMAAKYDAKFCWAPAGTAGMLKPNEDPLVAGKRETFEESGREIEDSNIHGPIIMFSSPGGSSETIYLFVSVVDLSDFIEGKTFGVAEEGENILPKVVKRIDLKHRLMSGNEPVVGMLVNQMYYLDYLISEGAISNAN